MKKNTFVLEISSVLTGIKGLEFLMQVGLKRGYSTSKIDLLAGFKFGQISVDGQRMLDLLRSKYPTGKFYICDDSIRFSIDEASGGIAVCDSNMILAQLENWIAGNCLEGQRRSWALGYWIPEALFGDLVFSQIIYDPKEICVLIKSLVEPYSKGLAKGICDMCINDIRQKLLLLEKLFRTDSPIELAILYSDLSATLIRFAFAQAKVYLRGFVDLNRQSKGLSREGLVIYEIARKIAEKNIRRDDDELKKMIDQIRLLFHFSST